MTFQFYDILTSFFEPFPTQRLVPTRQPVLASKDGSPRDFRQVVSPERPLLHPSWLHFPPPPPRRVARTPARPGHLVAGWGHRLTEEEQRRFKEGARGPAWGLTAPCGRGVANRNLDHRRLWSPWPPSTFSMLWVGIIHRFFLDRQRIEKIFFLDVAIPWKWVGGGGVDTPTT